MLSGRKLDILSPSPFDIEIEDIALGLSRVTRWNGQTTGDHPYSVAQHSLHVEKLFIKELFWIFIKLKINIDRNNLKHF